MTLNDVLYTPLDVPPKPYYSVDKLYTWLQNNYVPLKDHKDALFNSKRSAEGLLENYPWDLTVAYCDFTFVDNLQRGWLGNFDKEFPELSSYIYKCFNLDLDDIGCIVFLPIRDNHTGLGFWHHDVDWYGLRHYFCFERPDANKLLLRKFKLPYNKRPILGPIVQDEHMQDEIFDCKIISDQQSFFLNNVRAAHSTYTAIPNVRRIAALIVGKTGREQEFIAKYQDLVIRSAQKFTEHRVLW